MTLRVAIETAVQGLDVPGKVLEAAFGEIVSGKGSDAAVAGLLVALRAKGESVSEIVAVARALRAAAVTAPCLDPRTIDTCGTGGDGAQTFNISTTVAFVVAGAGIPVAKHGNRAASSRSGSIDVLEALGVAVDLPVEASARIVGRVGIAPFFARRAHPAMRHVAGVRQELGIRTLMNCMGPLLNPLGVRHQVIGVYAPALVEHVAEALCELGTHRALVVHGNDGLDELTLYGTSRAALVAEQRVERMTVDPQALGLAEPEPGALRGGDARENARILEAVLGGAPGPRRDVVVLNAGAALWVADAAPDLAAGLALARQSLDSGAAREKLEALRAASADEARTAPAATE